VALQRIFNIQLENYAFMTYVERDLSRLAQIRNLAAFERIMVVLAGECTR